MKQYKIIDEIFGHNFRLVVGKIDDFKHFLKKSFNYELQKDNGIGKYLHLMNDNEGEDRYFLWIEKFKNTTEDLCILSHELHHMVYYFGKNYGIDDPETLAYYYEFCLKKCLKYLK